MPEPVLVGIDLGTSAVKACSWSAATYRTARRFVGTDSHGDQDPELLWRAVVECLREVLSGLERAGVRGVGLSGHGPSLVAVGASGRPLSSVVTWMDRRPWAGSTGPSFEATAGWLRGRVPEAACLLQPKDYVALRLTGALCVDTSTASCGAGEASVSRIEPKQVEPWEAVGGVTRRAAHATGLPEGAPVAAGGIDAFVEALGAGVIEPGIACDSTGTSTCISALGSQADPWAVQHVAPGLRLRVEPVTYSGGSLAWALSVLAPEAGGIDADWTGLLEDAVFRTRPGAGGVVFIPHMTGARSEWQGPGAAGAFVGLRPGHSRWQMLRAVLEGTAFSMKECIQRRGLEVREFRAVGSGARHDVWLQMKADVLGAPVVRMAIREGALAGAAILAGMAAGVFESAREGVDAMVRAESWFEPSPQAAGSYLAAYQGFCEAERALGALSSGRAGGPGDGSEPERHSGEAAAWA